MRASAAIADPLLRRASAGGLAPRILTVLVGTGALLLAPVTVRGAAGQAPPQTSEPVPWSPRAGLAKRLNDFATNRHE